MYIHIFTPGVQTMFSVPSSLGPTYLCQYSHVDPFFYEFFLTHSIFISVERICSILLSAYKGNWQQGGNTETRIVIVTEGGMEQVDSEDVDGTLDETRKK